MTVLQFLQCTPETAYARREIARKAIRRQEFEENPHWVDVPLAALVAKGLVERNETGLFKFKKAEI